MSRWRMRRYNPKTSRTIPLFVLPRPKNSTTWPPTNRPFPGPEVSQQNRKQQGARGGRILHNQSPSCIDGLVPHSHDIFFSSPRCFEPGDRVWSDASGVWTSQCGLDAKWVHSAPGEIQIGHWSHAQIGSTPNRICSRSWP